MKKGIIWLVILVIAIVAISYVVRSDNATVATTTPDTSSSALPVDTLQNSEPAPTTGSTIGGSPSGVLMKAFTVTAQNYSFAPAMLTVKKGDRVVITLKNTEGFHDLRIDEFGVATKRIGENAEDTIAFTADKTGTFEYYCSVGDHRAMGMKGILTVN